MARREVVAAPVCIGIIGGSCDTGAVAEFPRAGWDCRRWFTTRGGYRAGGYRGGSKQAVTAAEGTMTMTGPTEQFFLNLERIGSPPTPAVSGSIRFDLIEEQHSEHWRVGIDRDGLRVTRDDADADCVVSADLALFDGVVSGQTNAMAALLRGELSIDGDPEMLVAMQRLFPAVPRRPGIAGGWS